MDYYSRADTYESGGWISDTPSYAVQDPAERLYRFIEEDLVPDHVLATAEEMHVLVLGRLHGMALAMDAARSRRPEVEGE